MEFVDLSRCISPLNTVNLGLPRKRSRSWWIGDPKHIQNLADPIGPGHHRQPGHTISQTGYHIRLGMSGQPLELHEKGPFDDDEDFHEMVRISKGTPSPRNFWTFHLTADSFSNLTGSTGLRLESRDRGSGERKRVSSVFRTGSSSLSRQ